MVIPRAISVLAQKLQCHTAKVVWEIIGTCLGADNTLRDMDQYKNWLNFWLPSGASVHMLGFAAICWAI